MMPARRRGDVMRTVMMRLAAPGLAPTLGALPTDDGMPLCRQVGTAMALS